MHISNKHKNMINKKYSNNYDAGERLVAVVIIIVSMPLLLILLTITAIVFRTNPIFSQTRTVNGEKEFTFFKIRSMKKEAPNLPTSEFVDTKIYINEWGNFLRKSSLDELLNLICVIRGDMKFIGPRPIMVNEIAFANLRKKNGISCKPGITGLAQINGRDLIVISRKLACERYYKMHKKNINIRLFILHKTAISVIKKSGIAH
jgi:O-antigen biosynthesis protein WbqP